MTVSDKCSILSDKKVASMFKILVNIYLPLIYANYGLIKYLIKENTELKNVMVEQQSKIKEHENILLEILKNGK